MSKLKKLVKQDFENKLNNKPSFDVNSLPIVESREFNSKRRVKLIKKVTLITSLSLVSFMVIGYAALVFGFRINIDENGRFHERQFSKNEIAAIESASFKKLNDVTYPTYQHEQLLVEDKYIESVNNFAYKIYENVEYNDNFSYSPLTLYNSLSILSLASDNEEVAKQFDALLGLSKQKRKSNFINTYINNYIVNENGTTQMYNGLFVDYNSNISESLVEEFTSYYTELYSIDFANNQDINKMLNWVDDAVNDSNYLSSKDLKINELTSFMLFSTLYFDNKWSNMYSEKDSYKDDFLLADGSKKQVEYMNHTYVGNVYRYDNYDSFYDYYKNGYKVQYVVPRFDLNLNQNIHQIIKDKNFLLENEDNLNDHVIISLNMPKFSSSCYYNFTELLVNNGLDKAFNMYDKPFNYLYDNEKDDEMIFLCDVFQKNKVSFNEDGTTIKSVNVSTGMNATAPAPLESITYKLNQPFIYVIYDINNIPLYIGQVDNP